MPAPSFTGFAGAQGDVSIGATSAETGIHIGDSDWSVDNPMVEFFDRWGGVIGKAVNFNSSLSLTINGEVSDKDAGVNVATFTAAATVANENSFAATGNTHHGIDFSVAEIYLTAASGGQPRGAGRTVSLTYMKNIGALVTP